MPEDHYELAAHYGANADEAPIVYVKPTDDDRDEVIVWWKARSRSGKKIGVTESLVVVKKAAR